MITSKTTRKLRHTCTFLPKVSSGLPNGSLARNSSQAQDTFKLREEKTTDHKRMTAKASTRTTKLIANGSQTKENFKIKPIHIRSTTNLYKPCEFLSSSREASDRKSSLHLIALNGLNEKNNGMQCHTDRVMKVKNTYDNISTEYDKLMLSTEPTDMSIKLENTNCHKICEIMTEMKNAIHMTIPQISEKLSLKNGQNWVYKKGHSFMDDAIFNEIDKLHYDSKECYLGISKESSTDDHLNSLTLTFDEEKRVMEYKKLFNICLDSMKEISKMLLDNFQQEKHTCHFDEEQNDANEFNIDDPPLYFSDNRCRSKKYIKITKPNVNVTEKEKEKEHPRLNDSCGGWSSDAENDEDNNAEINENIKINLPFSGITEVKKPCEKNVTLKNEYSPDRNTQDRSTHDSLVLPQDDITTDFMKKMTGKSVTQKTNFNKYNPRIKQKFRNKKKFYTVICLPDLSETKEMKISSNVSQSQSQSEKSDCAIF